MSLFAECLSLGAVNCIHVRVILKFGIEVLWVKIWSVASSGRSVQFSSPELREVGILGHAYALLAFHGDL